jgi:hypothetical protein
MPPGYLASMVERWARACGLVVWQAVMGGPLTLAAES